MARRRVPLVVLFSAPGTLAHIDRPLLRAGVRFARITSIQTRPIAPTHWLKRITRAPKPNTVVVTSRIAVCAGIRPWRRAIGRFPRPLEFWAVGPGTAHALREARIHQVHRPPTVAASAVAQALGRRAGRTIVYFRSDAAGPRLARVLRDQGHSVVDVAVYRLETSPRLTRHALQTLAKAELLIVTSPSALAHLRHSFDRRAFVRLAQTVRLVVLGDHSRRAARKIGFRRVAVAPSTTAQRFTRYLLRELRDAPA
ncbi:MAG: uroporphyrinogen-III synthase [Thermoplasmata archaeon]